MIVYGYAFGGIGITLGILYKVYNMGAHSTTFCPRK